MSGKTYDRTDRCIDCGSTDLEEPDFEGFIDCYDCGAAWIPGVAAAPDRYSLAWDRGES